ncbi:hypothetical protein ACF3M2_12260 [Tissierella carlieri]|uniref:hypothetical protein n=1 Tax=Tissierella carlieri TaxID=689904 RepID=UPI00386FD96D
MERPQFPKHQFIFNKDEFNALIYGLMYNHNAFSNLEWRTTPDAEHIINTIRRYARFYEENGEDFVQVNFYDTEVRKLIKQFICLVVAATDADFDTHYFQEIKAGTFEVKRHE